MYVIRDLKQERQEKNINHGTPVFDFENPIATQGDFLICFDDLYLNDNPLFCLYYKTNLIGYFNSLQSAKDETKKIK